MPNICEYFSKKEKVWKNFSDHVVYKEYFLTPPVNYTSKNRASLWHINGCLPRLDSVNRKFIIDVEHPIMLSGDSRNYRTMIKNKEEIKTVLSSDYCKKILPFSEEAKNELLYYLGLEKNVINKIEVLYPSITRKTIRVKKVSEKDAIIFLHVGNKFYGKGTGELIEAIKILEKKYKNKFICHIVCNDLRNVDYNGNSIIWHKNISYIKLYDLYKKSHIFVLPLLQDSFGVYLECLAFGLPMISTGIYDKKEIISDKYNGILINAPYSLYDHNYIFKKWNNWDEFCDYVKTHLSYEFVEEIYMKMKFCIENTEEIERMSKNMFAVLDRRFLTKLKNEKLRRIYRESMS